MEFYLDTSSSVSAGHTIVRLKSELEPKIRMYVVYLCVLRGMCGGRTGNVFVKIRIVTSIWSW